MALFYQIETKVLKQSVRRNIIRIPYDFMFELNENEYNYLTSQIVTLDSKVEEKIQNTCPLPLQKKRNCNSFNPIAL